MKIFQLKKLDWVLILIYAVLLSKMISDDQHVNVVMAVMVSSDGGTSGSSPGTCFRILLAWAGLCWAWLGWAGRQ